MNDVIDIDTANRTALVGWLKRQDAYTGHSKDSIAALRTHAASVLAQLDADAAMAAADTDTADTPPVEDTPADPAPAPAGPDHDTRDQDGHDADDADCDCGCVDDDTADQPAPAPVPAVIDTPPADDTADTGDVRPDPIAMLSDVVRESRAVKANPGTPTPTPVTDVFMSLPEDVRHAAIRVGRGRADDADRAVLAAWSNPVTPPAAVKRTKRAASGGPVGERLPYGRTTPLTVFRVAGASVASDAYPDARVVQPDDAVTCDACGLSLPIKKFPTITARVTGAGFRQQECRKCRDARVPRNVDTDAAVA